jgi:Na+/melibiose symporter-like transporter
VATGAFNIPLQVFLPAYYASGVGLPLQTVGTVFFIARLWGALSDPIVGWASDRTRTPYGRRKPWILLGGTLFLVGSLALFNPPAGVGVAWLALWLVLTSLGWTATSTPLYAWGGELSREPRQRSRVQAYIQSAASIGIFCVLLLPAALDSLGLGTPAQRIQLMGAFIAATLIVGLPLIGFFFWESSIGVPTVPASGPGGLMGLLRDPVLWRIVASDFCVTLGQGARGAVFVFYVSQYMHLRVASLLLLLQYGFGIVASPLCARISYRLGRTRTLIMAELLQAAINLLLLLVTPQRLGLLLALTIAQGLAQGSGNLMLRSMIYDVADHHRLRSGLERAGILSSIFNVTTNAAFAIAVGVAFTILARFGFHGAGQNSSEALAALVVFFSVGPALGHIASALLVVGLPFHDRNSTNTANIQDAGHPGPPHYG